MESHSKAIKYIYIKEKSTSFLVLEVLELQIISIWGSIIG